MTMVPLVLVVDDAPDSGDLYRRSLEAGRDGPSTATVEVVPDGAVAIQRMRDLTAPRPDLVILDLSMPERGGHEVLAVMRTAPRLVSVPVVVFTSSAARGDVELSYGLGANCHVVKPADADRHMEVIRQIEDFWLHTATLPPTTALLPAGG
jgi:two-component system, chemotaxis family, response regulator Rcp1